MSDTLSTLLIKITLPILLVISVGCINLQFEKHICATKAEMINSEYQYKFFGGGCYIKMDGKYYPASSYNASYMMASKVNRT